MTNKTLKEMIESGEVKLFHRTMYPFELDSSGYTKVLSTTDSCHDAWVGKEGKSILEKKLEKVRASDYPLKPSRNKSLCCSVTIDNNYFLDRGNLYLVEPIGDFKVHCGDDEVIDEILEGILNNENVTSLMKNYWNLDLDSSNDFSLEVIYEGEFKLAEYTDNEPNIFRKSIWNYDGKRGLVKHRLKKLDSDKTVIRIGNDIREVETSDLKEISDPRKIELDTANVILTYSCPNKCSICCTKSTPDSGGFIDMDNYVSFLKEIKSNGFSRVALTGGDPFIDYDKMLSYCSEAQKNGLDFSLSTSAFWADSVDIVKSKLEELTKFGMGKISISTDKHHQKNTPVEKIQNFLSGYLKVCEDSNNLNNSNLRLTIKEIVESGEDPFAFVNDLKIDGYNINVGERLNDDTARLNISSKGKPIGNVVIHWNGLYSIGNNNCFKPGKEYCNAEDIQLEPDRFGNNSYVFSPCCSPGNLSEGLKKTGDLNVESVLKKYEDDAVFRGLRYLGLDFFNDIISDYNPGYGANNICQICQSVYSDKKLYGLVYDSVFNAENNSELVIKNDS